MVISLVFAASGIFDLEWWLAHGLCTIGFVLKMAVLLLPPSSLSDLELLVLLFVLEEALRRHSLAVFSGLRTGVIVDHQV